MSKDKDDKESREEKRKAMLRKQAGRLAPPERLWDTYSDVVDALWFTLMMKGYRPSEVSTNLEPTINSYNT